MQVTMICLECDPSKEPFTVELLPKNDCIYEMVCPNGHRFFANILYHEFQKLFEVAVNALVDNYFRETIGSLTASYERFIELFFHIVLHTHKVPSDIVDGSWKIISRQSERQLGAFIVLFAQEFNAIAPTISNNQVELRNKVIHQGYFPNRQESLKYGEAVLALIRQSIDALYNSEHKDELIRSINKKGNFDSDGSRVTYYAYPLIGTNRPTSGETKSFEEMVNDALNAKSKIQ